MWSSPGSGTRSTRGPLLRVFAARETQRTIVLVSTSGGSGGDAGAVDFAEAHDGPLDAAIAVGDLAGLPARWHLIGHLQGNKARKTWPLVRMIHAVDSLKLLKSLDALARVPDGAVLVAEHDRLASAIARTGRELGELVAGLGTVAAEVESAERAAVAALGAAHR